MLTGETLKGKNKRLKHMIMRARDWWKSLKNCDCEFDYFSSKKGEETRKTKTTVKWTSDLSPKHQTFLSQHQIWCENIRSGNTGCHYCQHQAFNVVTDDKMDLNELFTW